MRVETNARLRRCRICNEEAEDTSHSGTFEPLLAGDRQRKKRVAKARNPLQRGSFEVSLS
jgi:hypothetical protein